MIFRCPPLCLSNCPSKYPADTSTDSSTDCPTDCPADCPPMCPFEMWAVTCKEHGRVQCQRPYLLNGIDESILSDSLTFADDTKILERWGQGRVGKS